MAYKSQAILWARDAMKHEKNPNREWIIYKYGELNPELREGWLHMSMDHYQTVKDLFPIMERVERVLHDGNKS